MVVVLLLVYKLVGETGALTEHVLLKTLCHSFPPFAYSPRSGLLLALGFLLLLVRLVPQARVVVLVATQCPWIPRVRGDFRGTAESRSARIRALPSVPPVGGNSYREDGVYLVVAVGGVEDVRSPHVHLIAHVGQGQVRRPLLTGIGVCGSAVARPGLDRKASSETKAPAVFDVLRGPDKGRIAGVRRDPYIHVSVRIRALDLYYFGDHPPTGIVHYEAARSSPYPL